VPIPPQREEIIPVQAKVTIPEQPSVAPIPPQREEVIPVQAKPVIPEHAPAPIFTPLQREEAKPVEAKPVLPEHAPAPIFTPPQQEEVIPVKTNAVPLAKPAANFVPIQGVPSAKPSTTPIPPKQEIRPVETKQEETDEQPTQAETEVYEDALIGQQKIKLTIPAQVIRQAQSASSESKNKLAGYWSAQIIKGNPQLMSSFADPVSIWFDVKKVILKKFERS
jgi:hypothetical protein